MQLVVQIKSCFSLLFLLLKQHPRKLVALMKFFSDEVLLYLYTIYFPNLHDILTIAPNWYLVMLGNPGKKICRALVTTLVVSLEILMKF